MKFLVGIFILVIINIISCGSNTNDKEIFINLQGNIEKMIEVNDIKKVDYMSSPISILDEKPNIHTKIGIYESVSGGLLLLTDGLNFFNELGFYPNFIIYPDKNSLRLAFEKGEVDIATLGLYESIVSLLEGKEFIGILPLTYQGSFLGVNKKANILHLNDLVNNKIIVPQDSIENYLFHKSIKNKTNLNIINEHTSTTSDKIGNNIVGSYLSPIMANKEINNLYILQNPTRHRNYKVESLLIDSEFANNNFEILEIIIEAYKKALLTYEQHQEFCLDIISNKLEIDKKVFRNATSFETIIPLFDRKTVGIKGLTYNENIIKDTFFNLTGIYNEESRDLLNFIIENNPKYGRQYYKERIEQIKLRLLRGTYFNFVYINAVGFEWKDILRLSINVKNTNDNIHRIPYKMPNYFVYRLTNK